MIEILQYPFMQRALITGIVLAILLAVLGVFVVLKRMAFFSDGIAHASLSGVAIGMLASLSPLISGLIFAALFAVLIYILENKYRVTSDAAIGLLFTAGMSLGLVIISLQPGYQPDLLSFLFGNILAIDNMEMWIIIMLSVAILIFIFANLKKIIMISLDMETARISGIKADRLLLLLYILLSVSVVLGIKILGVILVSALLIIPASTAKTYAGSFGKMLLHSIVISEVTIIAGIIISYYYNLPTGPAIVLVGSAIFITVTLLRGLIKK
jgi:zinc transport system permease protein